MRPLFAAAALGACLAAVGGCAPTEQSRNLADVGIDYTFELRNPPELQPDDQGVFEIVARFDDRKIERGLDAVTLPGLRVIANRDQDARVVAPTVRVKTGANFGFNLVNQMPYSPATGDDRMSATLPHGFNVMNLHTHGMHVANLQDNVLINVFGAGVPQPVVDRCNAETFGPEPCVVETHPYRYWVMRTHPSGTYWYHPHKHGAVALHLASGMGGALIVEDEERGLESLAAIKRLKQENYKGRAERILLFQHILYETESGRNVVDCSTVYTFSTDCFDGSAPRALDAAPAHRSSATATPVKIGGDQINQRMTVNGQDRPTLTMAPGETQLWRMVNTGAGDVLALCRVPIGVSSPDAPKMRVLAVDGNPVQYPSSYGDLLNVEAPEPALGAPDPGAVKPTSRDVVRNEVAFLSAGQRMDVLVTAPVAGSYAILHAYHPKDPQADPIHMKDLCPTRLDPLEALERAILFVNVIPALDGGPPDIPLPTPAEVAALVSPDDLTADPIYNLEPPRNPIPTQGVVFGFSTLTYGAAAGGGSTVNGRVFNGGAMQRTLGFEQTDLWAIQSAADAHMFHIHINPFQIVARGVWYYDMPIWRDTALINCPGKIRDPNKDGQPTEIECTFPGGLVDPPTKAVGTMQGWPLVYGEVLQFLTRPIGDPDDPARDAEYQGPLVLHCHNVLHEDNGMMELMQILAGAKT